VSLQVGEARAGVVTAVAVGIDAVTCSHPVRVAIDGPDAAGKTTLADELAVVLRARGREVIRASIDGFHRPRSQRHRQGPESPCGYYEDSFDQERLLAELLHPLGDAGSRLYRTRIFDYRADAPVRAEPMRASADAIPPLRRCVPPSARAGWRLGSPHLRHRLAPRGHPPRPRPRRGVIRIAWRG
jgi:uridine kinase